jgi:hypothetical protein
MLKQLAHAGPHPFRMLGNHPRPAARPRPLAHRFLPECGVLLVLPVGPLRATDFDEIALAVDPWRGSRGTLHGLVVQASEFPGWENVAGFVHHVQFVRDHRDSILRVALATDVHVPELSPELSARFIRADWKCFGRLDLAHAIAWAAA